MNGEENNQKDILAMEPSRRERWILFGAVPVVAAILGAIMTVVVQRIFGADLVYDQIRAVLIDQTITAKEKIELIKLLNKSTESFWTVLTYFAGSLSMPIVILAWAWSDRIRHGRT